MPELFIGCGGFSYPHWRASLKNFFCSAKSFG